MHRCDNADSNGTATGAYDGSVAVYRDELLGSYDATQLRHSEMNAIQEEIANVIRGEGYALNTDSETVNVMKQLETAIDNKFYASRVINNSTVAGAFVDDALDTLDAKIDALGSDDIANDSSVPGVSVSDALDTLDAKIDALGSDDIANDSSVPGVSVSDALESLSVQARPFELFGLEFRDRADIGADAFQISNGWTVGSLFRYLPLLSGKIGYTGGPWAAGNGYFPKLAAGVTWTAGNFYYIFVFEVGSTGVAEIGIDSDVSAANLIADPNAQAVNWRRVAAMQARASGGVYNRMINNGDWFEVIDNDITAQRQTTISLTSAGAWFNAPVMIPPDIRCQAIVRIQEPPQDGSYVLAYGGWRNPGAVQVSSSFHSAAFDSVNTRRYGSGNLILPCTVGGFIGVSASPIPSTPMTVTIDRIGWVDPRGKDGIETRT